MKKILVSGFEPFARHQSNPSLDFLPILDELNIKDVLLETVALPVSFARSFNVLNEHIIAIKPDFVICLGLAHDRDSVSLERIAVNIMDAKIADNDAVKPSHQKVDSMFPSAALLSTLPIDAMIEHVKSYDLKVEISNHAGTYVCNYVMFKAIAKGLQEDFKAGFIHLPPKIDLIKLKGLFRLFFEVL